ncbi:MAG: M20/M25/M40 family metallo-hydrolase [Deltaproteobacteria bacterium]|nr:M20/M25/M40 family metallo-hydrolase [Deltaproteobacteria bacterium]
MAFPLIIDEFLELVQVPAHSFKERKIADVLKIKLKELGLGVEEDNAGGLINGDCGNLIARWPGDPGKSPLLFSAHMDRVSNPGKIVPIVKESEDRIVSSGDTILAADDVAGIVAILDGIRRVKDGGLPHRPVEVVFSVAEEVGLLGSRNLDPSGLVSKMAYVLDTGGPFGTIVNKAPTQYTFLIRIHGKSSHAGMAPEKGLNAINVGAQALTRIKEGRLSPVTTANYGVISGGKATNIVCDYLEIKGEARSHVESELKDYLAEVDRVFKGTAKERGAGCDMDLTLEYEAFDVPEDDPVIALASGAIRALGVEPAVVGGGGGLDANYFNKFGIRAVGISTGYDKVHTEEEEQSISGLVKCGELVARLMGSADAQG